MKMKFGKLFVSSTLVSANSCDHFVHNLGDLVGPESFIDVEGDTLALGSRDIKHSHTASIRPMRFNKEGIERNSGNDSVPIDQSLS